MALQCETFDSWDSKEEEEEEEEEGQLPFDPKKASKREIIDHLANLLPSGIYLETTLLDKIDTLTDDDEETYARIKSVIIAEKYTSSEDPITTMEFDEDDIKVGLVRVWQIFYGKATLFYYTISSLYQTLLNSGNRYFTHTVCLPTGFTDKDLHRITYLYARSTDKEVGEVSPLRSKAHKVAADSNDDFLSEQLIKKIQEEDLRDLLIS